MTPLAADIGPVEGGPRAPATPPMPGRPQPERGVRTLLMTLAFVAILTTLFIVFVLARNDWTLAAGVGDSLRRAFSPRTAKWTSKVAGVTIHDVRRTVYANVLGQPLLVIAGRLLRTGLPAVGIDVAARFLDSSGIPVAEASMPAAGWIDPTALFQITSETALAAERSRLARRARALSERETPFMIVLYPLPEAVEKQARRISLEVRPVAPSTRPPPEARPTHGSARSG